VFKGETVPAPSFDLRSLRVLVVDDNATNRAILTEILDSWQMSAAAAASAHSALAMLQDAAERGQPFQLVLTDAAMPEVDGFSFAEQIASVYRAGAPKVILLTSAGAPVLRGRRAKLFAATLIKPVKQSDLLDTIVTAFATPASSRRSRAKEPRRRPRNGKTGLRVLVAEDNATNQKLVSALLEQQGHAVTLVGNGALALERAAQEPFDVILMDVQMPEMSGIEATAAIRKQEEGTGRHLPIVALTARAMTGDREQCLAAGMDAYVAKPVKAAELFSAIDAVIAGTPPVLREASSSETTGRSVDVSALLSGFGGRSDLASEVIDVFLADAPAMLTRLRHAAAAADASELAAAAHAIKGSAGFFSQGEAYERARALEMRARSGDASNAAAACDEIDASISRLVTELRGIRKGLERP
jgi:two-component system, sensor histidine kinase and response regulator